MSPIRRAYTDESGFAVVLAIVVLGVMLGLGLAALSMTDTQSRKSRHERERESSFNLAEGALQQQGYLLGGSGWPKTGGGSAPPASCTIGNTNNYCPNTANLANATGTAAYNTPDYQPGSAGSTTTAVNWTTYIRDNVAAGDRVYSGAVETTPCANGGGAAPCTWDANKDGFLWVRSTATVRGKTRTLVALLKRETIPIKLAPAVLIAGSLAVGHSGNKTVITTDTSNPPIVRCTDVTSPACVDYLQADGNKETQIFPANVVSNPTLGSYLTANLADLLLEGVPTLNHCPSEAEAVGVIAVDPGANVLCELGPPLSSPKVYNSLASPGMIIMKRGRLRLTGVASYFGVILHLNGDNVSGAANPVVDVFGNWTITGGVVIEGQGAFSITGSAILDYNPQLFGQLKISGAAGLVQNTWRELPPCPPSQPQPCT
jgi:Tfp pilus assembly protein PilX